VGPQSAAEKQTTNVTSWPERINQGDREAESELASYFGPKLEFILRRRLRNPALAADLSQDALIVVIERLRDKGIDNSERLAAFIYKTAQYLANNHGRKRQRRNTHADTDHIEQSASETQLISDQLEREDLADIVRKTLDELNQQRDRQLLKRFYLNDEDKVDLCREFDVTSAHFDRILYRARQRFGELIKQRLGSDFIRSLR